MSPHLSRRTLLASGAGALLAAGLPGTASARNARVVVVGGGFGGAGAARFVARAVPGARVTLVTAERSYTACPLSNLVIAGLRELRKQQFDYTALAGDGVDVVVDTAVAVDTDRRQVQMAGGQRLPWDRLILAPGIDLPDNTLPGYDRAAANIMPHAWQAGAQTLLLRDQLRAMPDGGLVVIAAPDNPYRCPPGPYERASLIAHYLKTHKPRSKLLILDAKDQFSKQPLFLAAWQALYGGLLEWQGLSDGARVRAVDVRGGRVMTDFDTFEPAVANIIPPQRAGAIAVQAGVTDASGWCPVDPVSFESTRVPGIHVIGDAAIANAMPKSAFAANAQAQVCALQVARLLAGEAPLATTLLNTCYSLVAPDYGISVAGVYKPADGMLAEVDGAGGISPLVTDTPVRALEASYAHHWFATISAETFG